MLKRSYLEFSEFDRNEMESIEKHPLIQDIVYKDPMDSLSTINAMLISGHRGTDLRIIKFCKSFQFPNPF